MSTDPLDADRRFFTALLDADATALDGLLTDDFVLIDVLQGQEIPRPALIEVVGSSLLRFDTNEVLESRVRRYSATALVTGRTAMRGRMGEQGWQAASRYTHVFIEGPGGWQMASAQGTPIAPTCGDGSP